MSSRASFKATLVLVLAALAALTACGSSRTSSSASSGESAAPARASTSANGSTTSQQPPSAPASRAPSRASAAPAPATRTAPAPAFTRQAGSPEGLSAALATVQAHGFAASDTTTYRTGQTLRVLVGRTAAHDGHEQHAFFFEQNRYLGTDASQPSATIAVVSQSDTEVTLAYSLYRPNDALCCPRAGRALVRFQLDNGRLQALDQIPPVNSSSAPSRR